MKTTLVRKSNKVRSLVIALISMLLALAASVISPSTASAAWYNGSFNLSPGAYNVGAIHVYDGNYMAYEIKVDNASSLSSNGQQVQVQVRAGDGTFVSESWTTVGQNTKNDWIHIYNGGSYYLTYRAVCTAPGCGTVKITATMYSWT